MIFSTRPSLCEKKCPRARRGLRRSNADRPESAGDSGRLRSLWGRGRVGGLCAEPALAVDGIFPPFALRDATCQRQLTWMGRAAQQQSRRGRRYEPPDGVDHGALDRHGGPPSVRDVRFANNLHLSRQWVPQGTAAGVGSALPLPAQVVLIGPEHLDGRVCRVCGFRLDAYRRDARSCSAACRAEASRLRAILNGSGSVPYSSIAERVDAARKRTRQLSGR
jgi:hypothetical protein